MLQTDMTLVCRLSYIPVYCVDTVLNTSPCHDSLFYGINKFFSQKKGIYIDYFK